MDSSHVRGPSIRPAPNGSFRSVDEQAIRSGRISRGKAVSSGGGLSSLTNPRDSGAENVTDAAHRADERGPIGAAGQLLAQSRNQRVDRTIKIGPFTSSEPAEQGVSRQSLPWMADEGQQEVELGRRQIDPSACRTEEVARGL